MDTYIYIYIYICMCVYIYIYIMYVGSSKLKGPPAAKAARLGATLSVSSDRPGSPASSYMRDGLILMCSCILL